MRQGWPEAWVQGWSAKDETSTARTTCSCVSSWWPLRETWGVREQEPLSCLPSSLACRPRPRPTYQLDGTVKAGGHSGGPGQPAEVRSPADVQWLFQIEDSVRHLGGGAG